MALSTLSLAPKLQIVKLCKHQHNQPSQLIWGVRDNNIQRVSKKQIVMAQMGEPEKLKMQMGIVRERLWEAVPDPVKDFPWKEAGTFVWQRLLFHGQRVLKWSLMVLFVFSFISDAIFALARNQELMIPLGLFVGCLMTDLMIESLQGFIGRSEGKVRQWILVCIGCTFVFVKVLSTNFVQGKVFLDQVANGVFMQLLNQWKQREMGNSL